MNLTPRCNFDDFSRALADETRQRILALLQGQEMSVTEICTAFELTQPTISHHLTVLRLASLVTTRHDGRWIYYRINPDCIVEGCQEILARFCDNKTMKSHETVT